MTKRVLRRLQRMKLSNRLLFVLSWLQCTKYHLLMSFPKLNSAIGQHGYRRCPNWCKLRTRYRLQSQHRSHWLLALVCRMKQKLFSNWYRWLVFQQQCLLDRFLSQFQHLEANKSLLPHPRTRCSTRSWDGLSLVSPSLLISNQGSILLHWGHRWPEQVEGKTQAPQLLCWRIWSCFWKRWIVLAKQSLGHCHQISSNTACKIWRSFRA